MEESRENYPELPYLNYSKLVLMILVVLYHSMVFWNGDWFTVISVNTQAQPLVYFSGWLNTIHIYCFVLISGYLFYYLKYVKKKESYNNLSLFIKNKTLRLLVPYLFILIIWVLPFNLAFYKLSIQDILLNYLLGISPNQLWFLLMLFILFLFYYFFSKILKEHNFLGFFICILFYMVSIVCNHYFENYFQIFSVLKFALYFCIGFIICQRGNFTKKIHPIIWLFADILIYVVSIIVMKTIPFSHESIQYTFIKIFFDFVLSIIGAIMAFNFLTWIFSKIRKENSVLNYLSRRQMGFFLFHQQLIYIFLYVLNDYVNPYLIVLVSFIMSILVSLLITSLFLLTKYSKVLIGEK